MKIKVFYASVNPNYYDTKKLVALSYDDAVEFFENEEKRCCTTYEKVIDPTKANEYIFYADGTCYGDNTDALLVYMKVVTED